MKRKTRRKPRRGAPFTVALDPAWEKTVTEEAARAFLSDIYTPLNAEIVRRKLREGRRLSLNYRKFLDTLLYCFLVVGIAKPRRRRRGQPRSTERWKQLAMMDLLIKENRASRIAAAAAVLPNEGPMGWKSLVRAYQSLKKHPVGRDVPVLETELADAIARLPVQTRK